MLRMAIGPDCRFCPKCGWEARVESTKEGEVDWRAEYDKILNFFGASVKDNGDLRIDMKKYHAAHLCQKHAFQPWKRAEIEERCVLCLQEQLAATAPNSSVWNTAIDIVMEMDTDAADWKSRIVAAFDAARDRLRDAIATALAGSREASATEDEDLATMMERCVGPKWKISNYRPYGLIERDPDESTFEYGDNEFPFIVVFQQGTPQEQKARAERIVSAVNNLSRVIKELVATRARVKELEDILEAPVAVPWPGMANLYRAITGQECDESVALGMATSAVSSMLADNKSLRARLAEAEAEIEQFKVDQFECMDSRRELHNMKCPDCEDPIKLHALDSRIVGCQAGDGSEENPICGCRTLYGEAIIARLKEAQATQKDAALKEAAKLVHAEVLRMRSIISPTSYAHGRREAAQEIELAIRALIGTPVERPEGGIK